MPKRNELTRFSDDDSYQRQFKEMFSQVVEEKVREALADRTNSTFQPFFQPQEISAEIRRRQTVAECRKWTRYFEEYGCLVCERQREPHASLGMFRTCYGRTRERLRGIILELTEKPDEPPHPPVLDRVRTAREALAPSIEILRQEQSIRQAIDIDSLSEEQLDALTRPEPRKRG